MQAKVAISLVFVLTLGTAGCTSSSLPSLPPLQPAPSEEEPKRTPTEHVSIVSGTPTGIYALVARGVHRCWLGADGPLKPTHVFHAEAESPANGGAAEIVLHERDPTMRDERGPQALRVAFSAVPGGVRLAMAMPRIESQLGQPMAKDILSWANGGTDCEMRRHLPLPVAGKPGSDTGKKR
jgi:hypothetical protein